MAISVFDIFKIGIGPSSSHTVGPMRAAMAFARNLEQQGLLGAVRRIQVELYGSLGATGKGHGTDKAVMLGLEGEMPDAVDPDQIPQRLAQIRETGAVRLLGQYPVAFNEKSDLLFQRKVLPYHSNGMRLTVFDASGAELVQADYYSVGGGFVVTGPEAAVDRLSNDDTCLPYPFNTGDGLLKLCATHRKSISDLMMSNEKAWLNEAQIRERLLNIWQVMQACVERGLHQEASCPAA